MGSFFVFNIVIQDNRLNIMVYHVSNVIIKSNNNNNNISRFNNNIGHILCLRVVFCNTNEYYL